MQVDFKNFPSISDVCYISSSDNAGIWNQHRSLTSQPARTNLSEIIKIREPTPQPCRSIPLCKPRLWHSLNRLFRSHVQAAGGKYLTWFETEEQGRSSSWEDNLRLAFHSAWADSAGMKVMPCFKHPPPQAVCLGDSAQSETRMAFFLEGVGHGLMLPILSLKTTRPFGRWPLTSLLPPCSTGGPGSPSSP